MHLYRHDYMGDVILQIPGTSQKKLTTILRWSLCRGACGRRGQLQALALQLGLQHGPLEPYETPQSLFEACMEI